MNNPKKIMVGLVLIVIIVGAVFLAIRRSGSGPDNPPDWYLDQPVEKMDSESLEVITKTRGEWERLGRQADGKFKNPNTGAYTMVAPMTCASCGEKIPGAAVPPPPRNPTMEEEMAYRRTLEDAMRDHRCPKCGQPANR